MCAVLVVVAVVWLVPIDACVRATPPAVRLAADGLETTPESRRVVAAKAHIDFRMVLQLTDVEE